MTENMDVYLAGKAAKGDVDAFETLIMKYEKTIYNCTQDDDISRGCQGCFTECTDKNI